MGKLHKPIADEAKSFKPVVLATGCGSGVGLALAHLLWKRTEFRVVVTARQKSLHFLLNQGFRDDDRFLIRALDINSPAERAGLINEIDSRWGGVNVLINNAGICLRSTLEHMTDEQELNSIQTNYLSPIALIRLALPKMREAGEGKIINLSSVSGIIGMPTMMSYSASKHALEGASEALWHELRPLGINVTLIQPGFIRSNSVDKVIRTEAAAKACTKLEMYSDYYASMEPFVNSMMQTSLTSAMDVANTIVRVIETQDPPLRIRATEDATVFGLLKKWMPERMFNEFIFGLLPGSGNWGLGYSNRRRR